MLTRCVKAFLPDDVAVGSRIALPLTQRSGSKAQIGQGSVQPSTQDQQRPTDTRFPRQGINGAAGVLAAGLAVVCSLAFSIDATIRVGGLCYLALLPATLSLLAPRRLAAAWALPQFH